MPRDIIKFNLRLSAKDGDLLLLAEQYHFSAMVLLAAQRYLGKTEERIPLPPKRPVTQRWFSITLRKSDDRDVFRLFQSIPSGYRGLAVKLMLRYAMEACDLRFILEDFFSQEKPQQEQPAAHPLKGAHRPPPGQDNRRLVKNNAKEYFPPQRTGNGPQTSEKKPDNPEDTIFDLI